MVHKIFRMVSKFTGVDGVEITTIYYALEKDHFNYYKEALEDVNVEHSQVLGVYASGDLHQSVTAAGGLLGLQEFPRGDLSESFSSKSIPGILNMRHPFWYKDNVQEDIPVNPQPTQKESVMSKARAKAQPSAVAAAASQVASTANNAATGSAADSAPTKTIHLSKVMEAAATAAKAASANATTQEGSQQMTDAAAEAMTELAKSMQAVADAVTTDVKETQSPQPVAEQQSTTLKETAMSDKIKTDDKPKAEDKKTEKGLMSKTKDVLTGPTAKAVGLVLLATAAGAAGGYGAVEMQRRRQMAAKGRMA